MAQYRELAAFSQFGSELDEDTRKKLRQGERIREVLKQSQYEPIPVEYQVIILYAATKKYLLDLPVEEISRFEKELTEWIKIRFPEIPEKIASQKQISQENEQNLIRAIEECKQAFVKHNIEKQ